MSRITAILFIVTLIAGCKANNPPNPVSSARASYRVQEGFPEDVIEKLSQRSSSATSLTNAPVGGLPNNNFQGLQSVIRQAALWAPSAEGPVTVAFLGGSEKLRGQIAATVVAWSKAGNIQFDFGTGGKYREWTRNDSTYAAKVRISFDQPGYWSFVGSDSINPTITAPNQPSMNYQGFTTSLPQDWQGTVLHEFGHAIGFEHEHQNPNGDCSLEFRWHDDPGYVRTQDMYGSFVRDSMGRRPGIYTVLEGKPNMWSQKQIDFNLKNLPNTTDYRFSGLDKKSIMMYSFQDWMFVHGATSDCYTPENLELSPQDQLAASQSYPFGKQDAGKKTMAITGALSSLARNPNVSGDVKQLARERLSVIQR